MGRAGGGGTSAAAGSGPRRACLPVGYPGSTPTAGGRGDLGARLLCFLWSWGLASGGVFRAGPRSRQWLSSRARVVPRGLSVAPGTPPEAPTPRLASAPQDPRCGAARASPLWARGPPEPPVRSATLL